MPRYIPGLIIGLALAGLLGFSLLSADTPRPAPLARPEAGRPEEPVSRPPDWPAVLAHHNFILHSFDGHELPEKEPEGTPPHLSFAQWPEVTGRFCNHFRGVAEVTDQGRLIIFAAATRMMCLEENLNQAENVFQQITTSGAELDLSPEGQVLTISGEGHLLVFRLRDYVK
ncbi:MAG: META domain-containing protein [Candidatus Adiutrix sp.]|jgi:heat shock protein HslJ|nr:META domain-containing protein [Candidatus Adiutrix sp.]